MTAKVSKRRCRNDIKRKNKASALILSSAAVMLLSPRTYISAQEATISTGDENEQTTTTIPNDDCREDVIIGSSSCHAFNETLCMERCGIHGTTYLLNKCCAHPGISASLLAFEVSDPWVDRLNEYNLCTGANIRIDYLEGGEDAMAEALIDDVGLQAGEGQGIYDAYIVQAPWLPPVYNGLRSLSDYIKVSEDYVKFSDVNQASRDAVSFNGQVYAFPLDTDYIAMGWRQDVFELHKDYYKETYGEDLTVPKTIEDLVIVSERLNGLDHNGDGEDDWGFCLSLQPGYFYAFLAPVLQTTVRECEKQPDGKFDCAHGGSTGQNIFFDIETFEPLIHNEGFRYAFEMYYRFVKASNCPYYASIGESCDRRTAFPTGRCAGVISLPGTLTQMLIKDGKYSIRDRLDAEGNVEWSPGQDLADGQYWGRRAAFPGSTKVMDWKSPGRPLVDCDGSDICPLAIEGINYSPFFSEAGESFALNGRQSKPRASDAMWDMFAWLSEVPINKLPLAGVYRKYHLSDEFTQQLAEEWENTVMADDLHEVLVQYFKGEDNGGNPAQDSLLLGFDEYYHALDVEMHQQLILAEIADGGLLNLEDLSKSLDPIVDKDEFDKRYNQFISNLQKRYMDINARKDGGALRQLALWRESLDIQPYKNEQDICSDLLATDQTVFDSLDCISAVKLDSLCQVQRDDVEEFSPGACSSSRSSSNSNNTTTIIVICSVFGGAIMALALYFLYNRIQKFRRIASGHEQLMEATLNESVRSLRQLDYPLHLVRGDEFVSEDKILRHEVLRNTHRLTVLDSLSDVDAFIDAGKHIVFLSHQWTSFSSPDASGAQYQAMCIALKELAKLCGWDPSLKDVFVWVDYCCLPQANASIQNLAVRSLAAYAASATYFVVIAPETRHADLDEICDIDTYQDRMWTRAEQVCHSMRNGIGGMYVAKGKQMPLAPVEENFFKESLRVFEGDLTCCRLEHKGMSVCDRQCLVIPLLGLYGELYRASVEGVKSGNSESLSSVEAFLAEIEKDQAAVFPPTFMRTTWRKNKQVTEEIVLFGDLIDRMKTRIKSGCGFAIDDDNTNTLSTMGSDYIRHGAGHGIRY